jgi:hypothetical protein
MKNPPAINQNHLTENRKQSFNAEELENMSHLGCDTVIRYAIPATMWFNDGSTIYKTANCSKIFTLLFIHTGTETMFLVITDASLIPQ